MVLTMPRFIVFFYHIAALYTTTILSGFSAAMSAVVSAKAAVLCERKIPVKLNIEYSLLNIEYCFPLPSLFSSPPLCPSVSSVVKPAFFLLSCCFLFSC